MNHKGTIVHLFIVFISPFVDNSGWLQF